jgi:hypothetical protein
MTSRPHRGKSIGDAIRRWWYRRRLPAPYRRKPARLGSVGRARAQAIMKKREAQKTRQPEVYGRDV